MKLNHRHYLVLFLPVVLICISLLQIFDFRASDDSDTFGELSTALPTQFIGWEVRDIPIGETESISEATKEILGSDNIIHREYKKSGMILTVFVVHWSFRNKVLPREIAFHSPDHCWTRVGFQRKKYDDDYVLNIPGAKIYDGKYRVFSIQKLNIDVVFWQTFGGEVINFTKGEELVPKDTTILDDFISGRAFKSCEQYFVRISSNVDILTIKDTPLFYEIANALRPIGIVDYSSLE
jgi:hypothetical protein